MYISREAHKVPPQERRCRRVAYNGRPAIDTVFGLTLFFARSTNSARTHARTHTCYRRIFLLFHSLPLGGCYIFYPPRNSSFLIINVVYYIERASSHFRPQALKAFCGGAFFNLSKCARVAVTWVAKLGRTRKWTLLCRGGRFN